MVKYLKREDMRKEVFCIKKIVVIFFILLIASKCYAGKLGELWRLNELGRSQDAMQKVLDKETKAFRAIKKAIEKGSIEKGQSQRLIEGRYGSPVVILSGKHYTEKWV